MRNYKVESQDNSQRKYRYNIDGLVRELFLKRIAKHIHNANRVLEIGSNDGSMTEQLLSVFDRVSVIEPINDYNDSLISKFGSRIEISNSTLDTATFDEKFDSLFLIHVLEHLDSPVSQLNLVKQWMSHDSKLFVMVPNAHAMSRKIAVKMGLIENETSVMSGEASQGHLRTYTMDHLLTESLSAGFQVVDSGGVMLKPLANFQLDRALELDIINLDYLLALDEMSKSDHDGASSIYVVLTL